MTEKVKKTTKKNSSTITTNHNVIERRLMKKTISNLTDIVAQLQHDVKKIKTRMGL